MSDLKNMKAVNLTKHPLPPEKESSYENHEIRVITYNIHSCVDKKRNAHPEIIAGIIDNLQADIVCLQEVDAQKPLSTNHNQARTIAKKLSMDFIFFPVEEIGLHSFGLAILSRYSFQEYHRSFLPNLFPRLKPRKRGAIRASILTPAGSIHIINVHLSLFKLERRKQLKILLGKDWLLAIPEDEPLIFCGDLNAGPSSKTYRTLSRYLTDVQKDIKKSPLNMICMDSKESIWFTYARLVELP